MPSTSILGRLIQEGQYELAAYRLVYGLYVAARKDREDVDNGIPSGADQGSMHQ